MKTKLLSIFAISIFFIFAACDDDSSNNNTNNTNNVNNTNNTNNTNNASCGNDIVETDEVCDGTALDSEDCTTVGDYTGGELACASDCLAFVESACTGGCGNNLVETDEVCDGTALDSEDCTTIGDYTGGELACAGDCLAFDDSACTGNTNNTTIANIDLGTAGEYVILAKSGVSTTGTTAITGDVGLSPADHTYLTGFSETMDETNVFSTSIYVTGQIYASDYAVSTPANLTTAVSDMENAYTTAAGLTTPNYVNLGAGEIGGLTLTPGLYKWGTGVSITTDVTISGSETDVWVFQIGEDLTVASAASVILSGDALYENIIWQVGSSATLNTGSHMEGIILTMTSISMNTGATLNGRLLSQSAVTMDDNTVTE
ncbi:MAG: ice-binding family protein [Deltaproteobacteria bacterium]|jgi:hypothetical protein|nr:ice-binding family protein [Deltaproteobacteria bacterium]